MLICRVVLYLLPVELWSDLFSKEEDCLGFCCIFHKFFLNCIALHGIVFQFVFQTWYGKAAVIESPDSLLFISAGGLQ